MSDYLKYRILEIIPGTLVWTTFVLAVILSFWAPLAVIYFIMLFDLYWLIRVSYFIFYLVLSWRRFRETSGKDWMRALAPVPNWERIYHVIFLPTYKESPEVIRATFEALLRSTFPSSRMIVVLAGEARDEENFLAIAAAMRREFADKFFRLLVTLHPTNLPDEIPGKGANMHYAGHRAKEMIDALAIPYENLVVSAFDIDTCVHSQYFAYLTFLYCTHPNPTHTSFQPVALYNNNMWETPSILRVTAFGTTFWLLTELARPERLFTFSSHSMSWRALTDAGFWQKNIVTEDSRIFLQCFLRYDGDYTVTPMYIPVSMDTAKAEGYLESLKNLYRQQRRWAWGVEHFPFMVWHFRRNRAIPWQKKIRYLWNLGEGMYSWATAPILIFLLGRMPFYLANDEVRASAVFQNLPFTLEWLMRAAMAGILLSAVLGYLLLPRRPMRRSATQALLMILQWALLPITLIFFGSIPAIDAQTRLMFGKYLGFYVTRKVRKQKSLSRLVAESPV